MKKLFSIMFIAFAMIFVAYSQISALEVSQYLQNVYESDTNPAWSAKHGALRVKIMSDNATNSDVQECTGGIYILQQGVSAETTHVGAAAKVELTSFGTSPVIKNILVSADNTFNSGSVVITQGATETTKYNIWMLAGTSFLIPYKTTCSGTITINAASGIRVRMEKE